jgi:predicted RND superfamily exporter protein
VVDDTIHFLHHFRRAYETHSDVQAAVRETLHTTGRALSITSLVLCGGFFIYTGSFLVSNVRFGILAGSGVLLALAADFFLVPALLSLIYGGKKRSTAMSENDTAIDRTFALNAESKVVEKASSLEKQRQTKIL